MSLVNKPDGDKEIQAGNANADAYVQGRGNTKFASLVKADLAADEGFVIIDLSDTTQFPHTETGRIRLYSLKVNGEKASDGQYIVYFGVITELDADNGSTKWFLGLNLEAVNNPTDSTDRFSFEFEWPYGLDLEVDSDNDKPYNFVSNAGHSGDTTWQNDTALDSSVADTDAIPNDGDLVMFVDETGGSGTISISVLAEYITEAASS